MMLTLVPLVRYFILITAKDCDFGACENGATCTQNVGSFECACADGFDGDTCEISTY